MKNILKDKVILVTGGTGTIGSELVAQILKHKPKRVRVLSRNETRQYYLMDRLDYPANLRMIIGDIRDKHRLDIALRGVDIIFHTAALKHVPFCEYNPHEAMATNIVGSQNVIDAAVRNGIKKVIGISTDKTANPLNVLGVSKLMMEKLFTNANFIYGDGDHGPKFSCVRFGNVAWSDGSVFHMWRRQAERDGTINITNKKMTRFFMSTEQAVALTLKAAVLSQGGETFILKMPSIKLTDLAKIFIEKYFPNHNIKTKEMGDRLGEKIHEELIGSNDVTKKILEDKEMFVLLPVVNIYHQGEKIFLYPEFRNVSQNRQYSSRTHINVEKIRRII